MRYATSSILFHIYSFNYIWLANDDYDDDDDDDGDGDGDGDDADDETYAWFRRFHEYISALLFLGSLIPGGERFIGRERIQ